MSRDWSSPRPRHDVPGAVLLALRPLLRHSAWRDAWILRGVGERYGPVLRHRPARSAPAPLGVGWRWRRSEGPPRSRLRSRSTLLALPAAAVAAVLGFAIAERFGGGQPLPALDQRAVSGVVQVSFPSDWRRRTAPVIPTLGLTDELALAPAASAGPRLVLGRSATAGPTLLPPALLAALPQAPRPQVVTLGNASFYRYLNLSPRGVRTSESVYALPTTAGTIIAACIADKPGSGFTARCERLLATVRLSSAKVLALSPSPSYGQALQAALSRLDSVRSSAGTRMSGAPAASVQAAAATELADAYHQAAAALSSLSPGPATAANSAVADALQRSGDAYRALAHATARSQKRAYASARSSVLSDASALQSALVSLGGFGYQVT